MIESHSENLRYRATFDVTSTNGEGDPFMAVAELVLNWVLDKEAEYAGSPVIDAFDEAKGLFPLAWNFHAPEAYRGGVYDADRWPALACEAAQDDEGNISQWVFEYDESDTSREGRRWHITIFLERQEGGSCRVRTQSSCRMSDPEAEPPDIPAAAPALIHRIFDMPWYAAKVGKTLLRTVPNKITVQSFEEFKQTLVDPERTLPIMLFCTGYDGTIPEVAKQVAHRAMGLCNTYVLDWSNDELREAELALFEKGMPSGEYACPKSSARLYLPGVDLTNHNASMQHKSWSRSDLLALRPSQFADRLTRRLLPAEAIPGIRDLWPDEDDLPRDDGYGDDVYDADYEDFRY